MSDERETRSLLRDNWYFLAAFVAAVVLAVIMWAREDDAPVSAEVIGLTQPPVSTAGRVMTRTEPRESPHERSARRREAEEEEVRAVIDGHLAQFDADPEAKDAPALLNAAANLERQKFQDYEAAARYYEMIISDYPQWEYGAKVYTQLATCYERLNDDVRAQRIYRMMTEVFPEDSQEYLFARQKLGF